MKTIFYNIDCYALGFLICVPIFCHLLFSWMGFVPLDDGLILAYSRRILEGQVPHRDFISIRPILSALLHLPVVALGGDYTFWLSRYFVWCEFACIAYFFMTAILKLLNITCARSEKTILATIAFTFSSNNFYIMAWHTIDGLFLTSIGLLLASGNDRIRKITGYFLLGMAFLCKQNYFLVPFTAIIALKDWRNKSFWLAIVLPVLIYTCFLIFYDATRDAIVQMSTHTDIVSIGIKKYIKSHTFLWGIPLGYFSILLADCGLKKSFWGKYAHMQSLVGITIVSIILLIFPISMSQNCHQERPPFLLFGTALGMILHFVLQKHWGEMRLGMLVLVIAWSTSISRGINSPMFGCGLLTLLIIAYTYLVARKMNSNGLLSKFPQLLSIMVVIVMLVVYGITRHKYIAFEKTSKELTYSLSGIFPGAHMIYTNKNMYSLLTDLRDAVNATEGYYAIIPYFCGYWVKSTQANPLSIDMIAPVELENQKLEKRLTDELEAKKITVIIPKVRIELLSRRFVNLKHKPEYPVGYNLLNHVFTHFTKTGETKYFVLYEQVR